VLCPNCGHDNIAGIDLCEICGSDLAGLDLPESHLGFRGRLLTGHISDISISPPVTATPDASVTEAIESMRNHKHGSVIVLQDGKLVGIFTERDVLTRVIVPGLDPGSTKVSEVMTPNPITLDISDPPAYAIHLSVAQGLRHLTIMEGTELKGLISVRDLLRHIHEDVLGV
jgi:CBS domain-containing protein